MQTVGEGALIVTELLDEGLSSESGIADGTSSWLLTSSSGDAILLVLYCRGCVSDRDSRPPGEWIGKVTFSSKVIKERAGEKPMRSGIGGEPDACMPAAARSTWVLFRGQLCYKKQ